MRSAYRPRRTSVVFLWRCVRMGMWRTPWVRRIVYRTIVGQVPVVRRRLVREPEEIMRAAAALAIGAHHGRSASD
jgi:hypothetical protein